MSEPLREVSVSGEVMREEARNIAKICETIFTDAEAIRSETQTTRPLFTTPSGLQLARVGDPMSVVYTRDVATLTEEERANASRLLDAILDNNISVTVNNLDERSRKRYGVTSPILVTTRSRVEPDNPNNTAKRLTQWSFSESGDFTKRGPKKGGGLEDQPVKPNEVEFLGMCLTEVASRLKRDLPSK